MNIIQRIIGHIKYRHIENKNIRMFAMIADYATPIHVKEMNALLNKAAGYRTEDK